MADTTSTIEYYQDLLLYQWINATNARGTIAALVDAAICDLVAKDMGDAFDIETSGGPQLDVLGEYIGFGRTIYGEITRDYLFLQSYTDPIPAELIGLTDYTDPTVNAGSSTWRYEFKNSALYELEDEEYRFLLNLKRSLNSLDNTLYSIETTLDTFFGEDIAVFDSKDMLISYYVSAVSSRFAQLAASQGLLPKPMGVGLSGIFSVPDARFVFGFQDSAIPNGNTTGFGDYVGPIDSGRYFLSATDSL